MKDFRDLTEQEIEYMKQSGMLYELYPEYEDIVPREKHLIEIPSEIKNPDFSGLKDLVSEIVDRLVKIQNTTGLDLEEMEEFDYEFSDKLYKTCIETFFKCNPYDLLNISDDECECG